MTEEQNQERTEQEQPTTVEPAGEAVPEAAPQEEVPQEEASEQEQASETAAEETQSAAEEQPQAQAEATEPPDGAVQDRPEDAKEEAEAEAEGGPGVDLAIMEALLFSTHHPLTAPRLAELLELPSSKPIRKAVKAINEQYEASGRCFRVEQVAGGYQMLTLPEYGDYLKRLHQREADAKLTKAALETLAIIAYKQPILRADIEAIRGVASGETVRSLMEKHLVKIAGRAEEPGRPILYGTTKRFLELFGLNSLKDLPQTENAPKATKTPPPPATPAENPAPAQPAPEEAAKPEASEATPEPETPQEQPAPAEPAPSAEPEKTPEEPEKTPQE